MNLVIYIDVLFFLNMIIFYIILSSTAFITGVKLIKHRILISAALGAIYSVAIFFPQLRLLSLVFFKAAASVLLVLIAFKYISFLMFAKELFTYYVVNSIYGGGMYAFYHFTVLGSKMNFSNGIYYINLPLWAIIALAFAFYYLTRLFAKISDSRVTQKNIREIEISFENKHINVNALFDTGNSLYDPISLLPVMLVESSAFEGRLESGFLKNINLEESDSLGIIHELHPNLKMRIVPFQDVSGKKNMIYAFKPQKISDVQSKRDIPNILVGITAAQLSPDCSYNALLHSKM